MQVGIDKNGTPTEDMEAMVAGAEASGSFQMDEEDLADSGERGEASRVGFEGHITVPEPMEGCLGPTAALTLAHGLRLALLGSSERILGYHNAMQCSPLLCMACSGTVPDNLRGLTAQMA